MVVVLVAGRRSCSSSISNGNSTSGCSFRIEVLSEIATDSAAVVLDIVVVVVLVVS